MQPLTVSKVTKAHVTSDESSARTKRRRSDEIEQHRSISSGGSSQTQLSDEISRLGKAEREQLLPNRPVRIPDLPSLALKADLHLPWNTLRSKTKRANSRIGALFRGGLLRVVTRYYARRGRVITWLSINKRGHTPKYLHSRALFRTKMGVSVRGYARTSVC
jgi:hypothetical protein